VTLWLDVLPDEGNATASRATPAADGTFTLDGAILASGTGTITLTALDRAGATIYRAVSRYSVAAPELPPLVVQLKQPYYTDEPEIEVRAQANLAVEELAGAQLAATLTRDGATVATREAQAAAETCTITFPLANLVPGGYGVAVRLTAASGEELGNWSGTVHRLSPVVSPSRVEVNRGGITCLNGRPFLPIIFYLTAGTEETRRAGNTVVFGGEDPEGCAQGLDQAQRFGLMGIPHLCDLLRGRNDWDGLRATVSRNKNHPALLSWYIADEPEGTGDSPELIARARDIIREIDPHHPVSGCNNTPSVFSAYAQVLDVHIADPYPIPFSPITMVADWTDLSRKAAGPDKPTWMALQTHDLSRYGVAGGRYPTADELRVMAYLALAHGAQGLAWWAYGHARESNWNRYEGIYAEVQAIEPYLLSSEGAGGCSVATEATGLHLLLRRHEGRVLLVVVNPQGEALEASLRLEGFHPTRATRLFDDGAASLERDLLEVQVPAMGRTLVVLQ